MVAELAVEDTKILLPHTPFQMLLLDDDSYYEGKSPLQYVYSVWMASASSAQVPTKKYQTERLCCFAAS